MWTTMAAAAAAAARPLRAPARPVFARGCRAWAPLRGHGGVRAAAEPRAFSTVAAALGGAAPAAPAEETRPQRRQGGGLE